RTPERGRIGVFNRSHYEEVLVVRVHPEYLEGQRLPREIPLDELWKERYESINGFERHLARNGTLILKFFLNVSKEEQGHRFRRRIERPDKNWKFSEGDLAERALWDRYMEAYQAALNATSRPWAPWYAIPADDKRFMRATVAQLIVENLSTLGVEFPDIGDARRAELEILKASIS
ncbi:MAG: polyphosphate kinase 2 family protein, partial [Gemmatimonadetes bacterium]|nr:polyphosphate kinase 2 family protein [Gemmatimonadota bacterium]